MSLEQPFQVPPILPSLHSPVPAAPLHRRSLPGSPIPGEAQPVAAPCQCPPGTTREFSMGRSLGWDSPSPAPFWLCWHPQSCPGRAGTGAACPWFGGWQETPLCECPAGSQGTEREDLSPLSPAEQPRDPARCRERIGSAWAGGETSIVQELGCRGTAPTRTCPLAAQGNERKPGKQRGVCGGVRGEMGRNRQEGTVAERRIPTSQVFCMPGGLGSPAPAAPCGTQCVCPQLCLDRASLLK